MKVNAIRIAKQGGPEVMEWQPVEVGEPGQGQILIRHTAVGLNYIDTYQRSGLYPLQLPTALGMEAAGVVEAVGPGVNGLTNGDRVAYSSILGSYSEKRVAPAEKVVKIPDGVTDQQAAAMMLKGMTVEYLLCRTFPVQKGQMVLFHAAAGGVGLIAGQWLKAIGAIGIGTAGGPAKCELAKAHGYSHVIDYTKQDFVAEVKKLTDGKLLPVVYDSIGKDTWDRSIDCLAPRGMMVSFGNASGAVTSFNPGVLAQKGSLFLTRPSLMSYTATRADLELSSGRLFDMVKSGKVKIEINQTYPLKDAVKAHRDLEGRKTTGSTVLLP
jgi:NADPH2:quinone reductase